MLEQDGHHILTTSAYLLSVLYTTSLKVASNSGGIAYILYRHYYYEIWPAACLEPAGACDNSITRQYMY
jgi:hypothetical protein